jgi:hypothetical protein
MWRTPSTPSRADRLIPSVDAFAPALCDPKAIIWYPTGKAMAQVLRPNVCVGTCHVNLVYLMDRAFMKRPPAVSTFHR